MGLSPDAIGGIVIGSVIGSLLLLFLIVLIIRCCWQGPSKGSNNKRRLEGKIIVITGGNSGIGKETALDLSRRGARVFILCRSLERGKTAADEISNRTGHPVEVVALDLASLESVRECAAELMEKVEQIDILINNAGIMNYPQVKTVDGFDIQFGTNHLGHFLLTEMLMPLIKKSEASGFHPRIVIISSMAHKGAEINWQHINWDGDQFNSFKAYGQSKLANLLHAKELARRLEGHNISTYAVHPGIVDTNLLEHKKKEIWYRILKPCFSTLVKTAFKGAQTSIFCAVEEKIEEDSGKYYADCKEKKPDKNALDEESQRRLWDLSEELVGIKRREEEGQSERDDDSSSVVESLE